MALISCPECGNKVSDKSKTCVHCGSPLQAPESKLIVHGLNERFLIGGTMRLYLDDVFVGEVAKFDRFETEITKDCTLRVECGVNTSKPSCQIKAGEVTKIQIIFRRGTTGGFYLQKVDTVVNGPIR